MLHDTKKTKSGNVPLNFYNALLLHKNNPLNNNIIITINLSNFIFFLTLVICPFIIYKTKLLSIDFTSSKVSLNIMFIQVSTLIQNGGIQPIKLLIFNSRYEHHTCRSIFLWQLFIYELDMVFIIFIAAKSVIILHAHEYILLVYLYNLKNTFY